LETRLKAMNLVGDMISIPGTSIPEAFQPIFSEFLKRLSDRVVEVRMSAIEHVKNCLLLNPFRAEASQILCECNKHKHPVSLFFFLSNLYIILADFI
jgi:sister-chromatid-cohesion protein PDS5